MLTHTPTAEMMNYHHRLLVFLKPQDGLEWIKPDTGSALEKFNELMENRYIPKFETSKERDLAKGWVKRAPEHLEKLESEKSYLELLKIEGLQG